MARIRSAVTHFISAKGLIALLAAAGLFVGACGSTSPSSTSSASPSPTPTPKVTLITSVNACTLVAAADASTAAGTTVSNLAGTSVPGACIYGSSDGATTVVVFAQAYADVGSANAVSPEQMAAALNGAYGIANAKVVSGIGDKAVEYSLTGAASGGVVIFVFKSNVVIMIAVSPAADPSAVEQLARTAVGRL
jgi:hypothetical protein